MRALGIEQTVARIRAGRVTPTVRAADATQADAWARQIGAGGIHTFEFTATTPGWEDVLRHWSASEPDATVGLGTVTTAETAERAISAGAAFLVSPFAVPEARAVADRAGILFIEGGFSPNEIRAAAAHGVAKLFPANIGGIGYLKTLLSVLPGAQITATGGISLSEAGDWLAAGALAVSIGSDLFTQPDIAQASRTLLDSLRSSERTA
ncbi:bifunctional 4-hydroxy-2-oxoglutarate aldolase/2-dehydro-3-deoxy-phosphogluconate aldolase [Cryobacterium lactosi]|uniref:Bifunctional 4-hydroxy-2-oxoglutarate aldolase/2-dehydro-3-deoxy-phosphogluconate aldolase n=1 Tax=Cryobacterium lactosi TaxID=1259202 RepID=A0A4R9C1R7_9MICO|nr:bifunctional 4-hydroxy-2-oxoglutarate aldolase/2-dehydro-3-deoxy-phosphogluconate aldolase [Cryobacterium lactosi]TFD95165.1 bifunctional 4-hydroxy-2-oxoglutarate aldolase/2-dehydro-3-deoxy-phosphogluconate aldolase [Cryobacterium lactosi]